MKTNWQNLQFASKEPSALTLGQQRSRRRAANGLLLVAPITVC